MTRGPLHHFFGYYDKSPWNADASMMLALQVERMDRPVTGAETARIVLLRSDSDSDIVGETRAWCWQQGCMLQWHPAAPDRQVVYNRLEQQRFVAVIHDVISGATHCLPRPIYTLSPVGHQAMTLNFARLAHTRPGYGYPALPDLHADVPAPDDDGVWNLNLATGREQLAISLRTLLEFEATPSIRQADLHWVNHIQYNTDGSRIGFVHRWRQRSERRWQTRMFTANPDGSELFLLHDENGFSHYDWMDPHHLLAWAPRKPAGHRYHLFQDRTHNAIIVGNGLFTGDGHCSFSPDRRWMLTDTYPDDQSHRHLYLLRLSDQKRFELGAYFSMPAACSELRCDLHPRWRRDGKAICFDSTHEGSRQMYVIDLSTILVDEHT